VGFISRRGILVACEERGDICSIWGEGAVVCRKLAKTKGSSTIGGLYRKKTIRKTHHLIEGFAKKAQKRNMSRQSAKPRGER